MSDTHLVAPGVRAFISHTLNKCHIQKDFYINTAINIALTVILFGSISIFLYFRHKGKPTPAEMERKKQEQQSYVMKKLGYHIATKQHQEKSKENTLSSNLGVILPGFHDHPELPILRETQYTTPL